MVLEGEKMIENKDFLKKDYEIAKSHLHGLTVEKTKQVSDWLKNNLEKEIEDIERHYENLLGELGGDLNKQIDKIKQLELKLRTSEDLEEKEELKNSIDRLRKGLLKLADDDARVRISKEKEFSINNAKQKNSLNISNKILNTTIIYYPVYQFNLYVKRNASKRFIELNYNPLTKELEKLNCEACQIPLKEIQIDEAGHIVCADCLEHCSECGKIFCSKCLSKSCHVCGKPLCKSCSKVCFKCGNYVCPTHLRKDCVSGEERCTMCLRACLRCHGVTEEKYFRESMDGSKVCLKCVAQEKRKKVMKNLFDN
jgi:hypothetical protein